MLKATLGITHDDIHLERVYTNLKEIVVDTRDYIFEGNENKRTLTLFPKDKEIGVLN